jgi:hypothetical protein
VVDVQESVPQDASKAIKFAGALPVQRGQGRALEALIKRRTARTRVRPVASDDLHMLKRRQAAEVYVKDTSGHVLVPDLDWNVAVAEDEVKHGEEVDTAGSRRVEGSADVADGSWDGTAELAVRSHPVGIDALESSDSEADAKASPVTIDVAEGPAIAGSVAASEPEMLVAQGTPEKGEPAAAVVPEINKEREKQESRGGEGPWWGMFGRLVGLDRDASSLPGIDSWNPHAVEQQPKDTEEKGGNLEASTGSSRDSGAWDWWSWLQLVRGKGEDSQHAAEKVPEGSGGEVETGRKGEERSKEGDAWWGWAAAVPAALIALMQRRRVVKDEDVREDEAAPDATARASRSGKRKPKPLETVIVSSDLPIEEIAAEIARVKRGEQQKTDEAKRKEHEVMMSGPLARLRAFTANLSNLNKPEIALLCLLSGGVLVLLAVVAYRLELYVEYQRLFAGVERVRPW